MIGEVPITIQASPFVLSHNTLHGDDWVEEEGLGKMWILITIIFNQALIMFINPLTILVIIDLHMLQIKWTNTEYKHKQISWIEATEPHWQSLT